MRWIGRICVGWLLAATACGGSGPKTRASCGDDDACAGGVCFEQQCYDACTSRDDCADDEICVWKDGTSHEVAICLLASDLAGCSEPADCQGVLRLGACEEPACTAEGLCDAVPRPGCDEPDACGDDACADTLPDDATDDGRVTSNVIHGRFPLPAELTDVAVKQGVSNPFSFRLELDEVATWFQVAEGSIDLAATLEHATFVPDSAGPVDDPHVAVSLRVGTGAERASVCSTGEAYGPADVTLDPSSLAPTGGVEPTRWTATEATIATINSGAVTGCLDVVPPVDGRWTLSELALDFRLAAACTEEPADLSGTWTGTYACTNWLDRVSSPEAGPVTLVVTQDGRHATYTDEGGASYEGVVCGRAFSFAGGKIPEAGPLEGYFESGRLEVAADGLTATKTSIWHGAAGWGTCNDQLTRQP